MAGLKDHAGQALKFALDSDPEMLASEVAWLDNGQLDRLVLACHHLADAAQAERNGRAPR